MTPKDLKYDVERFETGSDGLVRVTYFHQFGYRCGYVIVPEEVAILEPKQVAYIKREARVHWYVSLARTTENFYENITRGIKGFVFGFDCAHLHDGVDYNKLHSLYSQKEFESVIKIIPETHLYGHAVSSSSVGRYCDNLAYLISNVINKPNPNEYVQ